MNVIVAETAGFCFGVKRAVDLVYEKAATAQPLYTYGPIIHNDEVIRDLEKKGVRVLRSEEDLDALETGTVVIRSHGIPKRIYEKMQAKNLEMIDATCPFVQRIHKLAEEASADGYQVIVVGDAGHPEVEGILGWCMTPAFVIGSAEEAEQIPFSKEQKLFLVAQTTFNANKFQDIVEIVQKKGYNVSVVNTVCNATCERQTEARKIAAQVDAMIVIGDTQSSNSRKLYEICRQECEDTCFIQTLNDLHMNFLQSVRQLGITAGASTPNYIIEEVQNYVRINF